MKLGHGLLIDPEEALSRSFLGDLVLEVPHAVPMRKLFVGRSHLGQDPQLEAGHGKKEVGVVLAVDRGEGGVPVDGGDGAWHSVLDVPEGGASQVDIVLHESHPGVSGPTLFVVVAHNVLVVGVGMLGQITLDQVTGFLGREPKV